jgi:hypothetical protein
MNLTDQKHVNRKQNRSLKESIEPISKQSSEILISKTKEQRTKVNLDDGEAQRETLSPNLRLFRVCEGYI